jgi:hypothetical protein
MSRTPQHPLLNKLQQSNLTALHQRLSSHASGGIADEVITTGALSCFVAANNMSQPEKQASRRSRTLHEHRSMTSDCRHV